MKFHVSYPYLAPNRLSEKGTLFLESHGVIFSVPQSHRLSLQLKTYESACLVMDAQSALIILYDPFWRDHGEFLINLHSHIRALKIAMLGESLQAAAMKGDLEAHRILIELNE